MSNNYKTILNLKNTDIALFLLRIGVGGLMLTHGIPKLINLFDSNPIRFGDPIGIGMEASLALTVFSEVICSIMIIIGLGTRLAAIPLFFTMGVAFFIVHGADPFKNKELALFFMIVYLVLFLTGSGKYSLDQYFLKRKKG
ncbi:DoxX family protein [uncultured Planktosalinus sp.]|uniref:DoxX family protein n=1 Tax=uncultured Planktosalinus sp. TaxID=1810935 RepID=UPI0030D7CA49|tara:strand:+ start:97 stop:519 length:423 start_codon:yes stop_codon:yes gene_type:complete